MRPIYLIHGVALQRPLPLQASILSTGVGLLRPLPLQAPSFHPLQAPIFHVLFTPFSAAMVSSVITPHVLAIPLPAQGHINPLMRLCKILASNGFIVTFANVEPIHDRMNKASTSRSTSTEGLDIRRAHIPIAGLDLANDFRFSFRNFFQAVEGLTAALEQLLERLSNEGSPVTCLLSDVFTATPTHKLADKLNLPWVALFPSSQSRNLLCFYVLDGLIPMEDVIKASSQPPSDLFHGNLPGLPPLRNLDLPMYSHVTVDETEYIYSIGVRECRLAYERARAIVVNSFDELEGPAFTAMRSQLNVPLYDVGPLVGELVNESTTSLWPEETHYAEWLHQQPSQSVIYISFGTFTVLSRLQFEEVLWGLEASKQRFLWALRPDLVQGFSEFHFTGNYKDCGYFISWAPQLRVLSHPAIAGFITHCGWNSAMEAIASGVPMLCWPYFADQYLNAKFIAEEWKIGLRFQAGKSSTAGVNGGGVVTRCEVERVVRALMEGQEGKIAKKNVTNLRDASKRGLQVGGSSHTKLQALVHELGANKP